MILLVLLLYVLFGSIFFIMSKRVLDFMMDPDPIPNDHLISALSSLWPIIAVVIFAVVLWVVGSSAISRVAHVRTK